MKEQGLDDAGFSFNVITILGSQSSGKSQQQLSPAAAAAAVAVASAAVASAAAAAAAAAFSYSFSFGLRCVLLLLLSLLLLLLLLLLVLILFDVESPGVVSSFVSSSSFCSGTLMNALFGCHFQVMDALKGYSQTTKGLWIGRDSLPHKASSSKSNSNSSSNGSSNCSSNSSSNSSSSSSSNGLSRPVLLLDVEGLDSRERGDRRQTYENFFSLFALALADCLMINITCAALGCHTGSGFGLLKTVMEANLELFMQQEE